MVSTLNGVIKKWFHFPILIKNEIKNENFNFSHIMLYNRAKSKFPHISEVNQFETDRNIL
jgi:hypothetical protein